MIFNVKICNADTNMNTRSYQGKLNQWISQPTSQNMHTGDCLYHWINLYICMHKLIEPCPGRSLEYSPCYQSITSLIHHTTSQLLTTHLNTAGSVVDDIIVARGKVIVLIFLGLLSALEIVIFFLCLLNIIAYSQWTGPCFWRGAWLGLHILILGKASYKQ